MDSEMSDVEAYLLPTSILDKAAYVRDEDTEFCNKSNLANSIAYINQEFELLGLSCVTHDGTRCTSDMLFFINRLYDLLTLYQKIMAVKGDLETRNHRLLCEIDHYQNTALRGKKLQEQTDRELNQEREKTRQLSMKYKQVCSSLKTEKEEVRRLTAVLQSRDIQHKHEQKKKEKEVHRLKERLHQLLADKVPDRKVGMDLMNVVSRRSDEGRRATWKTGPEKQEEEMYHILINNYEERHQELMQENGGLRDCLLSLQRELSTLVKHTTDLSVTSVLDVPILSDHSVPSDVSEQSVQPNLTITGFDEGYFQMPYEIVRHEIERTFKEACDHISNSIKIYLTRYHPSMTTSKPAESNSSEKDQLDRRNTYETSEVERLKKQVNNYKAIIQQQEDLIQQSITSHSQSIENSFLHESQLFKEKETLSEQKKLFFEEKANFEKERRAFTEAANRLSKERQLLQEERARLIKQHFLSINSFKENRQKKSKGDGHMNRLLPATPHFSPTTSNSKVLTLDIHTSTGLLCTTVPLSPQVSSQFSAGCLSSDKSDHQGSISTYSIDQHCNPAVQLSVLATHSTVEAAHSAGNPKSSICSSSTDVLACAEKINALLMNSHHHQVACPEQNLTTPTVLRNFSLSQARTLDSNEQYIPKN